MVEPLAATAVVVSGIESLRVSNSSEFSGIFCVFFQNMDENVLIFQKYVFYEAMAFAKVY